MSVLEAPPCAPGTQGENDERRNRAREALALLSPEHRAILTIRDLTGIDVATLAAASRRSEGDIREYVADARMAFHKTYIALGNQ